MIYFLRRSNGDIKIGRTNNLKMRVMALNSRNKQNLELIGTMPETVFREYELHHRFAACRVAGEWFQPVPELLTFIDEHTIAPPEPGDSDSQSYVYRKMPRRNPNTKKGAGRPKLDRDETFVRLDRTLAKQIAGYAADEKISIAAWLTKHIGPDVARECNRLMKQDTSPST